jgi:hypothetical protein
MPWHSWLRLPTAGSYYFHNAHGLLRLLLIACSQPHPFHIHNTMPQNILVRLQDFLASNFQLSCGRLSIDRDFRFVSEHVRMCSRQAVGSKANYAILQLYIEHAVAPKLLIAHCTLSSCLPSNELSGVAFQKLSELLLHSRWICSPMVLHQP